MTGNERRIKVLEIIKNTPNVVSATKLGKELGVSRQIIVGDVALLRASGEQIVATARGYKLEKGQNIYTINVKHNENETYNELELLIDNGAPILDVSIEHPVYGTLTGELNIKSKRDIDKFLAKEGKPLSLLTDGIHSHRIVCQDQEHFDEIVSILRANNLLVD